MAIFDDSKHGNTLKLDFDPFDSGAVCSHFFPGGKRQALLDQLIEICRYSSDLAVVTGPLGSGKSTLAQWLELNLEEEFVAVTVGATLFMSAAQLLEAICETLSLETAEGATADDLLEQLDQYAETLRARSRTLQLLLDDAHELGEEALQAILDLVGRQVDSSRLGEDGVKVVLFGEPMLLNTVGQLLPSAHVNFELEALTGDEIADYVAFKLSSAGYLGRLPLDIDAMTVIEARSRGVPGAINAMVKDELGRAVAPRTSQQNLGFLERHLVPASALFAALLLTLFFTLGGDDEIPRDQGLVTTDTARAGPGSQRIEIPLQISSQSDRDPAATDDSNAAELIETIVDSVEPTAAQLAEQQADRVERLPQPASETAAVADVVTAAENAGSDAVEEPAPRYEVETQPLDPASRLPGLSAAERELLAKSPESYTVQLLGSHSETNVKNFIAGTDAPLSYFESRYQDRPWFVVVHGSYPDRATAREAIDRLPVTLRELQPWARNLSDIQADIRRHQ
jgi:DamX protein